METGPALAARIPGARFIAIESPNHLLLETGDLHGQILENCLYKLTRWRARIRLL